MNKQIVLIGGMPTAGKSTMAKRVAEHFDLPWISTDQIREIMRLVADRERHPALFSPEGYTAERFLTEFSAEQIVEMEMRQGEAVWPGIKKFIEDDYTWRDGFVMEGVNILPHLIARDFAKAQRIRSIFLVDGDTDRTREVVFTRGLWDDAHTYPDEVKEKEVVWATLFGERLAAEATKHGYPLIAVKKNDADLQVVLDTLQRSFA